MNVSKVLKFPQPERNLQEAGFRISTITLSMVYAITSTGCGCRGLTERGFISERTSLSTSCDILSFIPRDISRIFLIIEFIMLRIAGNFA